MVASIKVSSEYDLNAIAVAAGSTDDTARWYSVDTFTVRDVTQAALDAALASYNPFTTIKQRKLADLAARRYEAEISGITMPDGSKIATDRESQAMISGAYSAARDNVIPTFSFKAQSGFVSLTAAQVVSIGQTVSQHVQACFAHEMSIAAQINAAADQSALDTIDINAGWPS